MQSRRTSLLQRGRPGFPRSRPADGGGDLFQPSLAELPARLKNARRFRCGDASSRIGQLSQAVRTEGRSKPSSVDAAGMVNARRLCPAIRMRAAGSVGRQLRRRSERRGFSWAPRAGGRRAAAERDRCLRAVLSSNASSPKLCGGSSTMKYEGRLDKSLINVGCPGTSFRFRKRRDRRPADHQAFAPARGNQTPVEAAASRSAR